MSSIKLDGADQVTPEEKEQKPAFTVGNHEKARDKPRGSNVTPKQEMRVGRAPRDPDEPVDMALWNKRFNALSKKWDRENYTKKTVQ